MIFTCLIGKQNNKIRNKKNSFGLLELSVSVAVMGIIAGATLGAYNATNPQVRNDLKKMEKIEEALQQFFTVNGRLPFPANPTITIGNDKYLKEDRITVYNASHERCICNSDTESIRDCGCSNCNKFNENNNNDTNINNTGSLVTGCTHDIVIWGIIPTRSLGLPDSYAYDSQGHNFEYVTHATLAYPFNTNFSYSSQRANYYKTAYILGSDGKYNTKHETIDGRYSEKNIPMERLLIHDTINNKDLAHTDRNTAYVIISKGKTGKCYFDAKNNVIETTLPDDSTVYNCVQQYQINSAVDRKIYQGYSRKSFDNLVKYKTVSELMQMSSNMKDKIRNATIYESKQYLERNSDLLSTKNKNIIEAINELKDDLDALQFGIKAPSTSASADVGLENTDGSLTKNIALWKPGKYKFDNETMQDLYSSYLPKALDGNYYFGQLDIHDVDATSKNPLTEDGRSRIYEYRDYMGNQWIAKLEKDSGVWTGNEIISWEVANNCDSNWPIGSVYISTSLATADAVRNKLGCGTWTAVSENRVLWSISSSGASNNYLNACVPEVMGKFQGANREATFAADGALFTTSTNFAISIRDNGNSSCLSRVSATFSDYDSIWSCDPGIVRPASLAVYMWVRSS